MPGMTMFDVTNMRDAIYEDINEGDAMRGLSKMWMNMWMKTVNRNEEDAFWNLCVRERDLFR